MILRIGKTTTILAVAGLLASSLLLSGCDPDEQDRVLLYDKGTYKGKPDTALSDADREALRARVRNQGLL